MTLDEIADAILAEWYSAPRLRDFHNHEEKNPEKGYRSSHPSVHGERTTKKD